MDNRTFTSKLNNKMELWGMIDFENELGESDRKEEKIKDIFVQIFPNYSAEHKNTEITEYVEIKHKIRCRSLSIKEPKLDMFFIFKGQKYQFKYWNPDYKNNEFLEVFTELVLE